MSNITPRVAAFLLLLVVPRLVAADAQVTVLDANGQPVAGAGVAVYVPRGVQPQAELDVMDQRNEAFVPDFLVVTAGAEVSFPNSDQVLHHVYSFSPAKTFELPLYRGMLPSPVHFDHEGIVVIGCNIHDHMIGHVWVVDTTLHALTDANGVAHFAELPAGRYRTLAWHPRAGKSGVKETLLETSATGNGAASIELAVSKQVAERGALTWRDSY